MDSSIRHIIYSNDQGPDIFHPAFTQPTTETLAPIECVASLLQVAATKFATDIEARYEHLSYEDNKTPDQLLWVSRQEQRSTILLEGIVRTLENGLEDPEWSTGSSIQINKLHRQYRALLASSEALTNRAQNRIQELNGTVSIEEARKSLHQADSVRR